MTDRSSPARPSRLERQAYKWVMRMLDDPGANMASLERWLSKDPARLEIYKRVAIEVGYASDAVADLPLLRAAAVRHDLQPQQRRPTIFIAGALATALIALAVIGWRTIAAQLQASGNQAELAMLVTNGTSRAFRLADGSQVTLFGPSRARVHFGPDERAIDLQQGRARFSVSHEVSRPFTVYVQGGKVTAVGTVFEVDAHARVEVQLLKGRVIVTLPQQRNSRYGRQVALDAGQRITFPARSETVSMAEPPDEGRKTGGSIKSYDDVSVADIIAQVNALSSARIELADSGIGEEKVFAELNVSDVEAVARKLAVILDLGVERIGSDRFRLSKVH